MNFTVSLKVKRLFTVTAPSQPTGIIPNICYKLKASSVRKLLKNCASKKPAPFWSLPLTPEICVGLGINCRSPDPASPVSKAWGMGNSKKFWRQKLPRKICRHATRAKSLQLRTSRLFIFPSFSKNVDVLFLCSCKISWPWWCSCTTLRFFKQLALSF